MNKLIAAVALSIAFPGMAHAQAAPAGKPRMECSEAMKDDCACCDRMAGKPAGASGSPSSNPHAGHDMAPDAAPADGHAHH